MLFSIIIMAVLGIVSVKDIKSREIPAWLLLCCAGLSAGKVIFLLAGGEFRAEEILISLIPGALFLLLSYVTRQKVGYGDGLLMLCIGPAAGAVALLPGMCVAVMLSGLFSGVLLAVKKAGRNTRIPFAPFMTFGLGVMLLAPV